MLKRQIKRWARRLRWWIDRRVGIISLLLLTLLVAVTIYLYCNYSCEGQHNPYQYCEVCGWLRWVLYEPILLFTAVLTIATIGMWFVMWKTLNATRESVNAFVSSERGRFTLVGVDVSNTFTIHFQFRNSGSEMRLLAFGTHLQTIASLSERPRRPKIRHVTEERTITSDAVFGSELNGAPESGHRPITIPQNLIREIKQGRVLVCSFGFICDGQFGISDACFTYRIPVEQADDLFSYFGQSLWYDNPPRRHY